MRGVLRPMRVMGRRYAVRWLPRVPRRYRHVLSLRLELHPVPRLYLVRVDPPPLSRWGRDKAIAIWNPRNRLVHELGSLRRGPPEGEVGARVSDVVSKWRGICICRGVAVTRACTLHTARVGCSVT